MSTTGTTGASGMPAPRRAASDTTGNAGTTRRIVRPAGTSAASAATARRAESAPSPAPLRPLAGLMRSLDRPLTSYYLIVSATWLLLALGLVMVLSASSVQLLEDDRSPFSLVEKQALWTLIGLPVLWIAMRLPLTAYRRLAYPVLAGCLFLLALVPVIGVSVLGNKNWLPLPGGMNLQPSELAKLALIVWSADLLARKERLLTDWKHLLVPLAPVVGLVLAFILIGHDLGTALIVMAIVAGILYVVGAPLRIFAGGAGLAALAVAFLVATSGNRVSRIGAWLNPATDQTGSNFQLTHGKYALATGGWWGLGLGASRQKWGGLPEAHTDFIYAIIGEELGLLGTVSVLLLFAALALGGYRIAARSSDLFVRLAAAGVTTWITAQVLVNIGAVLGLLPIVGVPLPLVSYGGSALIPMLAGLGMLASFARAEPEAALALRSRPPLLRRLFPRRPS